MGLGEADLSDDRGGDGMPFVVSCSICLEAVRDKGGRSTAKLQCGHEFHLDCIGSAFNAKGLMQCPNCRKIEKGQWLYANGCRSYMEFSMDDWTHDEDLYDLSYSEVPFGVHWCPFTSLTHLPSFEEGDSTEAAYHDFLGHHTIFAEHTSASSAVHSCPYVPYFQPLQPSSSSNSANSVANGPTFHHWDGVSGPSDITTSHAFPAVDIHHNNWDHRSPPFSPNSSHIDAANQAPVSSAMLRSTRADSDGFSRAGVFTHPFFLGHGSGSRAGSSVALPPFLGNSQAHARVHGVHSYHQQPDSAALRTPIFSSVRRSTGPRGSAPIGSAYLSSDHSGVYPVPSGSSTRNLPDAESNRGNHFYAWERDRFAPYPLVPIDSDSNWWGQLHHAPGGSDSSSRAGFWHRHGSERQSSQGRTENSYQPVHLPRMHPFI